MPPVLEAVVTALAMRVGGGVFLAFAFAAMTSREDVVDADLVAEAEVEVEADAAGELRLLDGSEALSVLARVGMAE